MRKFLYFFILIAFSSSYAQKPRERNAAEIYKKIENLNFLGSVLYVGAHPDDENTQLISYLENKIHAHTAYLSLTRGDGGQNLIGPELRELLGIIRTQELLSARRIDGGEQFFTRANDFGFSKNPQETFSIWNKNEVLSDVIRVFREFQPDVVINRFDENSAGKTHGHHTASAILSVKAFQKASDTTAFPQQLENLNPWKPKKQYFNTSAWFHDSDTTFEAAKKDSLKLNTGLYFPLLGLSNSEIAALSRSRHKSQGFGTAGKRGAEYDYLKLLSQPLDSKKEKTDQNPLFAGINTRWDRLKGGKKIGKILYKVQKNFNFQDPATSIPELVKAYELIQNLENQYWKRLKSEEIKEIISASAGLFLDATTQAPNATPEQEVTVNLEAINRSGQEMKLTSLTVEPIQKSIFPDKILQKNQNWKSEIKFRIPEDAPISNPYWLEEKPDLGMYKVANPNWIGKPETPRYFKLNFTVKIGKTAIPFSRELVYKSTNPVQGETYQDFKILPKISISLDEEVLIFPSKQPKPIRVHLKAFEAAISGKLKLESKSGWEITPNSYEFDLSKKGEEKEFSFQIIPPENPDEAVLIPKAQIQGKTFSKEVIEINYPHIPLQTAVLPASTKAVKLKIEKRGSLIGYIPGAGDVVPQALEQLGYRVILIPPETISPKKLKQFDAIIMGIRVYNISEKLKYKQHDLLEYVKSGGNLIVQYNTSQNLKVKQLAPYKLQLSHDRVTDEHAKVEFLAKNHPVLNEPNKINQDDFEGWVQERGLYFPDEWAPEFTPILSMHDPGETPKDGSLLVAKYGKGYYVYTGLSFFREFPAGVPGAFRLFANLISLGKNETPTAEKK